MWGGGHMGTLMTCVGLCRGYRGTLMPPVGVEGKLEWRQGVTDLMEDWAEAA